MSASYTPEFDEVLAAERGRIRDQRRERGVDDEQQSVGLALSGGGMRSASFALGVLQALERGNLLRRVDYLSSVSGGGYIGAALTWFRRGGEKRFPFGVRGLGIRRAPDDEPSRILGFLRQQGDYLTPAGAAEALGDDDGDGDEDLVADARAAVPPIAHAGLVVRAIFLSTFIYGSILVGLFFVLDLSDRLVELLHPILSTIYRSPTWDTVVSTLNTGLLAVLFLLVLLGVGWIAHPFAALVMRRRSTRSRSKGESNRTYSVGLWAQRWTGRFLGLALIAGTLGSVPLVAEGALRWLPDRWVLGATATASIVAGALLGFGVFRRDRRMSTPAEAGGIRARLARLQEASAAFLMLYGLLVLSHVTAVGLLNSRAVISFVVVLAVGVAAAWLANINQLNISRMYRDRLMETFLPGERAISHNQWRPAFDANLAPLKSMCGPDTLGPYHLINSNLVTTGSRQSRFRSRGGDSFTLSPLYCGSDATGWRSTEDWVEGHLTLSTAMAASGPKERPMVRLADRGAPRSRLVAAAMFALGLRSGFWTRNPHPEHGGDRDVRPNYLDPGLAQGVFSQRLHERASFIELSDGGDFDELGIYELLRRGVDVIVAADASDDEGFTLDALANAVERARVDFGVEIEFADPKLGLEDLLPGAADGHDESALPAVANRGFAVGRIRYPDASGELEKWGTLLYLKATLVSGVPPDVLGHKLLHANFPHEAVTQDSVSEGLIEAYRELGYRIAKQLVDDNIHGGKWL